MALSPTSTPPPSSSSPDEAHAPRAQLPLHQQPGPKLFFAGLLSASFAAFSTRRALARRRLQFPEIQNLTPRRAPVNPAIQARQSASDSVLSKGQTSTPTTSQAGQSTAAPGYASAATESAQAASHGAPNASAEAVPAAEELRSSSMVMAVEALSLATLNVLSWGTVGIGGALWRWDIRSMDELRRAVRGPQFADGTPRTEQEVQDELEEYIVNVLVTRKEDKEKMMERLRREREE